VRNYSTITRSSYPATSQVPDSALRSQSIRAYSNHAGLAVIRTVWLAVFCLIGLGAMVAIRAGTPPTPPSVRASPEQTSVAENFSQDIFSQDTFSRDAFSQDTLTKADKLKIAYAHDPVAVKPLMLATKAPDETPSQPPSPVATPKIVSRHWHDPNAKNSGAAPPGRRTKHQEPKTTKNVERAKAPVDLRPCRRPEGFAGLLRALNLSPGCDA
jgi:hypothetical protein